MNEDYNNVLGAIYKNNIIIFHKEYQIYDSFVLCNFIGTYSYVLQNYFTSVFAKLRMYSYMSYGESIKRAENFKRYLMLGLDKIYYEKDDSFLIDKRSLLTAFAETTYNDALYSFENEYELNTGYFCVNDIKYLSDMQRLISGYSLCFNVKMYDNIAGGIYIKKWQAYYYDYVSAKNKNIEAYSEYDTINEDGSRIVNKLEGSNQAWYIMPASLSDAFIENIGIYIGVDNNVNDLNFTNPSTTNNALINYENIINVLPATSQSITNALGNTYHICKDNKELIDATFQIEFLNGNPINLEKNNSGGSLVVSNWFLKLCDLYGNYIKSHTYKNYINYQGQQGTSIDMIYGWWPWGGWIFQNNKQVVVLRIADSLVDTVIKANYEFENDLEARNREIFTYKYIPIADKPSVYILFSLIIYPLKIVSVSDDKNTIVVLFQRKTKTGGMNSKTSEVELTLTNDAEPKKGYRDYKFSGDLKDSFDVERDWYISGVSSFPEHTKDANISNSLIMNGSSIITDVSGESFSIKKSRNMYISVSKNIIDNSMLQKTFTFDNFEESGCYMKIETLLPKVVYLQSQMALSIIDDHTMRFSLDDPFLSQTKAGAFYNSVQYWFYDDEGDKLLHLVLNINLPSGARTKGYVDIYSSLILSKDERVFDYLHNEDYRIKNYVGDSSYGTEQGCVKFVYVLDGIEYVKVGEEHITKRNIYYHKANETELNELTEYYVI